MDDERLFVSAQYRIDQPGSRRVEYRVQSYTMTPAEYAAFKKNPDLRPWWTLLALDIEETDPVE